MKTNDLHFPLTRARSCTHVRTAQRGTAIYGELAKMTHEEKEIKKNRERCYEENKDEAGKREYNALKKTIREPLPCPICISGIKNNWIWRGKKIYREKSEEPRRWREEELQAPADMYTHTQSQRRQVGWCMTLGCRTL